MAPCDPRLPRAKGGAQLGSFGIRRLLNPLRAGDIISDPPSLRQRHQIPEIGRNLAGIQWGYRRGRI